MPRSPATIPRPSAENRAGDAAHYRGGMGLNPFRPQDKTALDVAMVIVALALTAAALAWALFGG